MLHFIDYIALKATRLLAGALRSQNRTQVLRFKTEPNVTPAASGMGLAYLACALGDRHPDLIRTALQTQLP